MVVPGDGRIVHRNAGPPDGVPVHVRLTSEAAHAGVAVDMPLVQQVQWRRTSSHRQPRFESVRGCRPQALDELTAEADRRGATRGRRLAAPAEGAMDRV